MSCLITDLRDFMGASSPWEIAGPLIALLSVVVSSTLVVVMARRDSKQKAAAAAQEERRRVEDRLSSRRRRVLDAWMTAVNEVQHFVANWERHVNLDDWHAASAATLRYIAAARGVSKLDEFGDEVGLGSLVHTQVYPAAVEAANAEEANGFLEHARRILRFWSEGDLARIRDEYGPWPVENIDRLTPSPETTRRIARQDAERTKSPDPPAQ